MLNRITWYSAQQIPHCLLIAFRREFFSIPGLVQDIITCFINLIDITNNFK
jgi:hypothetical protein